MKNVIILGAAGRDFHDFLTFFKKRPEYRVVAFTAEQIPGIAGRRFPAELSGKRYPDGIPIYPESKLPELVKKHDVEVVTLAYSDLPHQVVMEKASRVLATGARFMLLAPDQTWVPAKKPVVAVTAVRTGCGKSQTARAVGEILRSHGVRVMAIRHSMPYGRDLRTQACQHFETVADFKRHKTTIEEEEEYQPWIDHGFSVFAGFDYREIVKQAQRLGDVLIFDGGNNDLPMVRPDLLVTVLDPHRAGHELSYYPGFVNLLRAHVVVINKVDSAERAAVNRVIEQVKEHNSKAVIIRARSELVVDRPERIKGKRCAVIGDGPTLSHGGMAFGAGTLAAQKYGGRIADPRRHLVGSIAKTFEDYPHLEREIPAMGYSRKQIAELEETVNRVPCDIVLDGSPALLERILKIEKPVINVGYELGSRAVRALEEILLKRGLC